MTLARNFQHGLTGVVYTTPMAFTQSTKRACIPFGTCALKLGQYLHRGKWIILARKFSTKKRKKLSFTTVSTELVYRSCTWLVLTTAHGTSGTCTSPASPFLRPTNFTHLQHSFLHKRARQIFITSGLTSLCHCFAW